MNAAIRLSLVMATYGRVDEIHRLLDSLDAQTSPAFELIIVDQNPDGFLAAIRARLESSSIVHRYMRIETSGLSMARNAGLEVASADIVGFPDDDCWYEPDTVAHVVEAFEFPDIGGVVAHWCERDDSAVLPSTRLDLQSLRGFRLGLSACSICLFFRRSVVDHAGRFDQRLGVPKWFGSGEEHDLLLRVLSQGAAIPYRAGIRVHHPYKQIDEGPLRSAVRRAHERSRGTGALYAKHRLDRWVIARGLCGPLMKGLLPPWSMKRLLTQWATALGRLEGWLTWQRYSRDV